MRSQTSSKRKILGQYYTPDYIVEFMVYHTIAYLHKKTNYNNANLLKVLDPACGAGIFLVQALKFFLSHYSASKSNSLSEEVRKSIIADQLYGIDIDDYQIAKTLKSLNCLNFNANFKVFNALLPPPSFNHSIDSKMLKKLRLHYKEIYKSTNDISSFKEVQKRIFEIEKRVKKTLTAKLIELFQIPSNNIDPMPWETVFPETDGKFDVILGNPPWGAELFSSNLLNCYRVGTQQVDSWSLFLEKSLMALKEGGRLGFVIPNTLLLNENYTDTRKFILEVCKIIKIINLGENVFSKITQPCMILIVEKQSSIFDHKVEVIRFIPAKAKELLKKGQRKISSLYTIPCNQGRFLENLDYQLDIFSIGFEKFKELIEKDVFSSKIEVLPLRDLVDNARGVELNKNGKIVQCSSCGWWSSPPSLLNTDGIKAKDCSNPECHEKVTENDTTDFIVFDTPQRIGRDQPFLVGHQIQRYCIKGQKYIDPTRVGINYKDSDLYHKPKLLLRKTGQGINTAVDYDNRWVNQVVYLFKLKKNTLITLEYLMGVLNSKLIHKYYFMEFADPYRQDFPHFTQKKFLSLPIKVPITDEEFNLVKRVEKRAKILQSQYQRKYSLVQEFKKENMNLDQLNLNIRELEKEIDILVLNLYGITPDLVREVFPELNL